MSDEGNDDNIVMFPPRRPSVDLVTDSGLPPDTRLKWALIRVIALRLEDAGLSASRFAQEVGEDPAQVQRWLDGLVGDVSIDSLAALFDAVAEGTNSLRLDQIIDNAHA